jgi:hypothetical protein
MSKGAGAVERRIADLFAATRDRALSIGDLADNAYELGGRPATREQRLSATRAAHRLLRRLREMEARAAALLDQARASAEGALGREAGGWDREFYDQFSREPACIEAQAIRRACSRVGMWDTTTVRGRLYLHPFDVPVQVWAVSIGPGGVAWHDAEVVRITERNVVVRYAGESARLDRRRLSFSWAWWRGVRFVSSRTGFVAAKLEAAWWERYGASAGPPPPNLRMPLAEAMALLGVGEDYTKEDVLAAFRKKVKQAHPDLGGTAEMFQKLVEARDRLLKAIGAKARPPKPPQYYPKGMSVVYRVRRSSNAARLSAQRRLR